MIRLVKRTQLDEKKYNHCISNSFENRIFAYSWYLDAVTDSWEVLVCKDYSAVMPLPFRIKYGIKYVYPPFWVLELGMFSQSDENSINEFISILSKNYQFVELKLNTKNYLDDFSKRYQTKELQFLYLNTDYHSIYKNYKKDKKKVLKRAKESELLENWNDNPEKLIELFKKNIGSRISKLVDKDYEVLLDLMNECLKRKTGELLTIYSDSNEIIGAGFFLKNNGRITILVSATDNSQREKGINTFLIDRAIYNYHLDYNTFHFGGSSIKSIATYFKSFGSETENYLFVKKRLL
jgi:hypothetical protein